MDYRICGLFVLFFLGVQSAAAQSSTDAPNTSTAINKSTTVTTPSLVAPSTTPVPGANSTTPVPGAPSTIPVPGANSTTPVPGAPSTTPVPGANSTTPVPGANSTTPVSGTPVTTPDPAATVTKPSTVATTPKPANCLIGTCTGEECDNTTHTSTYTSLMCATGKCATQKHTNGTFTYSCAEQSDNCETNKLELTCCDTTGCNTHEAYKQEITKLGKKNDASTVTAQFHLLSVGIISLRLILM